MLCMHSGQNGRSLLHFDDKKGGDKGDSSGKSGICECKHADWFSYGYCSVGTTSSDVKGCQQAYMVCCGWAKVCFSIVRLDPRNTHTSARHIGRCNTWQLN